MNNNLKNNAYGMQKLIAFLIVALVIVPIAIFFYSIILLCKIYSQIKKVLSSKMKHCSVNLFLI